MNTRQQDIVTLLEQQGEITIKQLARQLNVSEMTIHRDLDLLENQHFLYKKRGAAVFVAGADQQKSGFYLREKTAIGRAAAALIRPGQSVIFDNSTTALACIRCLDQPMGLTLYTTNLEGAELLAKYDQNIVYCSGGYFFPDSKGFVGEAAERFVASVRADVCIIGASGLSTEWGVTTPYPMHTALQKKIIAAAGTKILLADHSKFGRRAAERVADLSEIDLIVTDAGISDRTLAAFRPHVKILVAQEDGPDA